MRVIGLTGGIGSGKSTVSRWLDQWGAPVVDADVLVRCLQSPGEPGWRAVFEHFGWSVVDCRGELIRKKLGRMVFQDPARRAELDAILHPLIERAILERLDELRRQSVPVAVLDVALLIEKGWNAMVDEVWLVRADEALQVDRICRRDGLSPQAARLRVAAQMPLEQKRKYADRVIDNSGTLKALKNEVRALWESVNRGGADSPGF